MAKLPHSTTTRAESGARSISEFITNVKNSTFPVSDEHGEFIGLPFGLKLRQKQLTLIIIFSPIIFAALLPMCLVAVVLLFSLLPIVCALPIVIAFSKLIKSPPPKFLTQRKLPSSSASDASTAASSPTQLSPKPSFNQSPNNNDNNIEKMNNNFRASLISQFAANSIAASDPHNYSDNLFGSLDWNRVMRYCVLCFTAAVAGSLIILAAIPFAFTFPLLIAAVLPLFLVCPLILVSGVPMMIMSAAITSALILFVALSSEDTSTSKNSVIKNSNINNSIVNSDRVPTMTLTSHTNSAL